MSTPFRAKVSAEKSSPADPTSEQPLPEADFGSLELAEIVDVKLLHSLIDDFHAIVNIPMGIIDMKGKMLVGVGWQDICRTFHRVHPETCKNCIESDTELAADIAPGEFKLYKCKNNMWDIATPLIVCNQHVGNIFSVQIVFDDEPPDVEFFRTQARRYGFNEEQYLAALAAVPRLSREHVNTCMTFLTKLAHMISQNGYNSLVAVSSQQSLAHLASFPELNPNPIFETDLQGKITYVNPAARLRFTNLGEMGAGHTLLTGWPSILASLKEGVERSMVREVEADGSVFHQEIHYLPERATVRSYFVDITAHKRAEQALIRCEKLASVGRMAVAIAHEINNPLEAVTNLLFITKEIEGLPQSARHFLETADAELRRIAHITRQSLGFYRESNTPALTSVNAVLESTVDLLKSKIVAKHAMIEKQWDGDVQVTAVAGELRQVFSNLLVNSLDAIDEKGTIKLRVTANHRCVRVTIADNGKGISASVRQHIFEPFFTTKGTVGTGLGLWISKQIIEKHGGVIQVHSKVHRGTVISIVLRFPPNQGTVPTVGLNPPSTDHHIKQLRLTGL